MTKRSTASRRFWGVILPPSLSAIVRRALLLAFWLAWAGLISPVRAAGTNADSEVLTAQGTVETCAAGSSNWLPAKPGDVLHLRDRLRTGLRSRATVRLSNLTVLRVNELTTLQIQPPSQPGKQSALDLQSGAAYFFSRERPTEMEFRTPLASGAIRGTEFHLAVAADGRSVVTLLDGAVTLSNALGSVELASGEQGTVEPGQAPVKTAVIDAVNIIQWCLYYPAVLDPGELNLSANEQQALAASLQAYRRGELLAALAEYPAGRTPASEAERIYWAALLLAVGQVDASQSQLADLPAPSPLADALTELITAVKFQSWTTHPPATTASQLVADSYYLQSHSKLAEALAAARAAVAKSPNFGFGWERVAELEFSFGRTAVALEALDRSLKISPRNAEALALKGFLLSAQNNIADAPKYFDEAIAVDGALGNPWLGRGLVRIRRGDGAGGLGDLQTAAVLEPRRSLLRSYLGKAFNNLYDNPRAAKELALAQSLDPNDPTPWLYLALVQQQDNRINPAITNLQASQDRNDNRSVFRSRMLLDEDRAVGSANLASIYRDAGMTAVSLQEAARAVTYDYANDSAHLFLADTYNDLRDPTRFNLRYETVWFNELLLANVLSPVGGGRLSQEVSQEEYGRLFQADGLSLASSTDARSDGMFHEQVSQFGATGKSAYSLDLDYQHNNGVRVNNSLDDIEWYSTLKQQITSQDTALVLVKYESYQSGDNFQYYYPTNARPDFKFDEYQQPILVAAWNHEWGPGMHTLFLGGRLINEQHFSDTQVPEIVLFQDASGAVDARGSPVSLDVNYDNSFVIYSAELNQICEWNRVSLTAGARYQSGSFKSQDELTNPSSVPFLFNDPPAASSTDEGFERITGYGYLTVEPADRLWLTAGLAYDHVRYPNNFRAPPVTPGEAEHSQLGPKAALVWNPFTLLTVRGDYTRSLGGVSLDESYRLEPTQLAGFPQAFRSLISESVVGSVAAPTYETMGLALDLKFGPRTFAGIEANRLKTGINRGVGAFVAEDGDIPVVPGSIDEQLDYEERSLSVNLNRLVSDNFVLGTSYQLTKSTLHDAYPGIPTDILTPANPSQRATLHVLTGYLLWSHPTGFFTRAEAQWYDQSNAGYTPALPDSSFIQGNLYAGYRFAHRRAELMVGLLNIGGQDYHLNPLTVYSELPRKRVVEGRFNFVF